MYLLWFMEESFVYLLDISIFPCVKMCIVLLLCKLKHSHVCYSINSRELRFSRAMIFAIEEINNSTDLLPGIKLGYQIHDSCASVPVAVHVAFQLLNGQEPVFHTSENCSRSGMVMGVVGESGSTPSISISRIIGSFNIPQVNTLFQNVFGTSVFCFYLFFLLSI